MELELVDKHIVRCIAKKNAALLNLEGQIIFNDLSQVQQQEKCNAPYCDAPIKKWNLIDDMYNTYRYIITATN